MILSAGCTADPETSAPPAAVAETISPLKAYTLTQNNQRNPYFAIIDVRTAAEFTEEHIEGAINIDFRAETFSALLDILDKNKTYLIYCQAGSRSGKALNMMAELGFREVYNLAGGIDQWRVDGFAVVSQTNPVFAAEVTPEEASNLIRENKNNPDFVIIDLRTPAEFAEGHIENAVNTDYTGPDFRNELDRLDKDKTYLVYYSCACDNVGQTTMTIMKELNFKNVFYMPTGSDEWAAEGFPLVK
jgi:rhodanese-related sulfurtransferase